MKSDRRATPEVRSRRSRGGLSAVNMFLVRVEEVMKSGDGYFGDCDRIGGFGKVGEWSFSSGSGVEELLGSW